MNPSKVGAVAGLVAMLGATAFPGGTGAQENGHGAEGDMMQGMDHGQMMQGMGHGEMTSSDQAQSQGGHDGHGAGAIGSPATEAYRAANLAMHEAMNIEFTDNADVDFARGMIGHHEGAIDMARIVLEHGEDPDLRQLAEEIIESQEAEIAFLRQWITENAE